MKNLMQKVLNLITIVAVTGALAGCASGGNDSTTETAQVNSAVQDGIVNVGVTDTIGGLNPLTIDQTEINKYAVGLMYLPLVELDDDLNFQNMLADSVTTEDNRNFVVHIHEDATWSDGTPITAYDVEYTFLRLASPIVNNPTMMLYAFEGVNEDGFVEEGAKSVSGVQVLDEKTIQFTSKEPMALTTFQNSYARYLHTLPKHVIEQFDESDLLTAEWFNQPDVVSGPYIVKEFDSDHYVSYEANENYWKGTPNIEKLNIKIIDGSQVYSSLLSGEIDITHHTLTAIPQEDYESIEKLENVDVVYGKPITNQSVFIQTANLTDERVRQALVYAIDREQILQELMKNHGEIVDGFLSSAGPFYSDSIVPLDFNPEKAKELLEEANWDSSRKLTFYVNSGDATFVNAAQVMVAQWAAVGIQVEVKTVDLANLMSVAGTTDYDMLAVQYTYAPVDPYPDVTWLLAGEGSWTGYSNPEIDEAMSKTQLTSDIEEIRDLYTIVNKKVQEEVPMFSAYIISAQGAVNKRLSGAEPKVYGFFNDVHNWELS